jgi:hypothetical protein
MLPLAAVPAATAAKARWLAGALCIAAVISAAAAAAAALIPAGVAHHNQNIAMP